MTKTGRFLVVLAVFGLIECVIMDTSLDLIQAANADTLSSSLQFKVKKIAADIAKSRSSLASNGPALAADAFKAKQFKQRIDSYAASLAKMPDVDDPILVAAKQDAEVLQREFEAAMGSGSNAAASTNSSVAPAAQSVQQSTSTGPELVSGQRVQVKKLARDIANVTGDIVVSGPSPMQSGQVVGKYNNRLQQFADALARYEPYKHDPGVQTAAGNYQALVAALTAENERAQVQLKQLGDAQARLRSIDQKLRSNPVPDELYPPFTDADAAAWVALLVKAKNTATESSAEIEAIAPLAYLPDNTGVPSDGAPYDARDLQSLLRYSHNIARDVDETIDTTQQTLKHRFDFQDEIELNAFRNLDPSSKHDRMNSYLREGAEGDILGRIDQQMALAQSVAAYQRAFGKEPTANTLARIDEITGLRQKYLEDRRMVLGDSRLPEPASTDAERIAIAEKILANEEYEFGEHGPVVLTTEKIITREKEVSRDTIKDVDISLSGTITMSGSRESWNYKWDEFKFATPIKDDSGDWYIWWITAKKYESGWEKTPIGYWVSGSSVKGSLILAESF